MNFKYRIKYKGQEFLGNSLEGLSKTFVKEYRITEQEANKIVKKLSEELIPTIKNQTFKENKKGLTFKEAVNGAKAVLKASIGIGVEQEVINERAAQCTNCPKLNKTTDCSSCGFSGRFIKWMKSMVSIFKKPYIVPNGLDNKFCSICDCSIAAMLPAQLEDFKQESEEKIKERKKVNCWIIND